MRKCLILLFLLLALSLAACGSAPAASTNDSACPVANTVQTGTNMFEQSCVRLAKGDTLTIQQDQQSYHVLDYGEWNGSTAAPETYAGAPVLKDMVLSGSADTTIGPFATAGTYHVYCTVHPGMELTIIVS